MGDMADFIIDRNINYVDEEMLADNEEALEAEELPFTDMTATSEDDTAAYHGQERAV